VLGEITVRSLARQLACLLWLALATAAGAESALLPPAAAPAPVRVHDHIALTFAAPDGARTPAQRAAEASENLSSVIDNEVPGDLLIELHQDSARVRIGDRVLFRLVPADAGAAGLSEFAPRVQTSLDNFLRTERQRARLQNGVLRASLVVFFGVIGFLLLRLLLKALGTVEQRLTREKDETKLPDDLRRLARGPWRSVALVAVAGLRLFAVIAAGLIFLLAALSLFESTRPWRDRLAAGVTEPFTAFLHRLGGALPNLLLLALLLLVLRGAWQAITQAFARASSTPAADGGVAPERVRVLRLLARAALLLGGFLLLPLVIGGNGGLLASIGLVGAAAAALAFVPLAATVVIGAWAQLGHEYRAGEWLRLRLPFGREITGEVVSVDFTHLRVVPENGGDVRVPHLTLLFTPVVHLPAHRALTVEVPVERATLGPAEALRQLEAAARWVAEHHGLETQPIVKLLELMPGQTRFSVGLPGAPESLRNELLLALIEATTHAPSGAATDA
jgi:hypothetical protein